jgi:5-formyltetrahydrofolate cyclo-ligase
MVADNSAVYAVRRRSVDSSSVTAHGSDRKRTVRRAVLAARADVPLAVRAGASAAVVGRLLDLPEVRSATAVAAFVGVGTELDTAALLDVLHGRGTRVLLPVLLPDDSLAWRRYAGRDRLVAARRGLLEPAACADEAAPQLGDVDVVVVPGVCYDLAGRRLGRGRRLLRRGAARAARQRAPRRRRAGQ